MRIEDVMTTDVTTVTPATPLDDSPVEVTVHGGEAVLTGKVKRRTQAELLPQVAEAVPGVVAVRSELGWSEDDA
jgi:osmotically-inducible protein OsmY